MLVLLAIFLNDTCHIILSIIGHYGIAQAISNFAIHSMKKGFALIDS